MIALKDVLMSEIQTKRIRGFKVGKPTLWPSQAGVFCRNGSFIGKCLRSSFYEKMGVPETNPVSDGVSLMGYMGTMIEDGLIGLLKNRGMWEANNVKWNNGIISGEVDVIIRDPETNTKWVVECKSCNGYHSNKEVYGFMSGREPNKKWTPGKPKDKHELQSVLYADIARGTTEGVKLIYISRDEAKLQEFTIVVKDDGKIYINGLQDTRFVIKDIYDCYAMLSRYIETNTLPEECYRNSYNDGEVAHLYNVTGEISKTVHDDHMSKKKLYLDKDCSYCSHKDQCLADGIGKQNNYLKIQNVKTQKEEKPKSDFDWFDSIPVAQVEERPSFIVHGSL